MVAIILHLYYQDLWQEFKQKLLPLLNENVHLYVTVNGTSEHLGDIFKHAKKAYILENRGADFGPFLYVFNEIKDMGYKHVLKIHGKRSLHNQKLGDIWRKKLTEVLIETPEVFNSVIDSMNKDERVFMAGAYSCFYDTKKEPLDSPGRSSEEGSITKLNTHLRSATHGSFFAGSMFMASKKYLDLLFKDVDLTKLYGEFEAGYHRSGTMAHAMERVIGYSVEHYGGKFLIIN
jgi:lipopolysaccharide biosynthesis protein